MTSISASVSITVCICGMLLNSFQTERLNTSMSGSGSQFNLGMLDIGVGFLEPNIREKIVLTLNLSVGSQPLWLKDTESVSHKSF